MATRDVARPCENASTEPNRETAGRVAVASVRGLDARPSTTDDVLLLLLLRRRLLLLLPPPPPPPPSPSSPLTMASLLERISLPPGAAPSVGPVRSKSNRAAASSGPYNRNQRPPKGNVNDTWKHDLFNAESRSLSARLSSTPAAPGAPKLSLGIADKALRDAIGEKGGLSIKGASSRGNVVQVSGLARGTTAADVEPVLSMRLFPAALFKSLVLSVLDCFVPSRREALQNDWNCPTLLAIFKRCGPITSAVLHASTPDPVVRLTYKNEKDAQAAVAKFHGQPADGRTLEVKIVGAHNASLSGRIGAALVEGSVDVLMGDAAPSGSTGSKLRSDELLAKDARAHVLLAPPGADPKDYVQKPARGRGRGRGRGRRGGAAKMDVDR
ncbi:hypothetical protein ACG7TL_008804 [Trametes sanguinea]